MNVKRKVIIQEIPPLTTKTIDLICVQHTQTKNGKQNLNLVNVVELRKLNIGGSGLKYKFYQDVDQSWIRIATIVL